MLFPRELAPRLHDNLVGLCRRAGFEPTLRKESLHAGWDLQVLADVPGVALAPALVARHTRGSGRDPIGRAARTARDERRLASRQSLRGAGLVRRGRAERIRTEALPRQPLARSPSRYRIGLERDAIGSAQPQVGSLASKTMGIRDRHPRSCIGGRTPALLPVARVYALHHFG